MAEDSKIQWTTHTFNCWRGCTKISAGCANCYAETLSGRNPKTLGVWGPNGTRVVAAEAQWREPVKWNKAAEKAGERHRVFCASLADVFEGWPGQMTDSQERPLWTGPVFRPGDGAHTHWWRTGEQGDATPLDQCHVLFRVFDLIRRTPHLDWLLLTKRPQHINHALAAVSWTVYGATDDTNETICWLANWRAGITIPRNVWLGTSVENQAAADARIPHLLATPAAVRFLSCEPLLEDLDLRRYLPNAFTGFPKGPRVNWVIVGGESGPGARELNPSWVKDIVNQCRAASVACFVKQLGANVIDFAGAIKDAKGGVPEEWPSELRVREFPTGVTA